MAASSSSSSSTGSGLTRKVGPLPLWAWLAVAAVVGFVLFRRVGKGSSSGVGPALDNQAPASSSAGVADMGGSLGLAPSAGSPGDTGVTTSDYIAALGGERQDLLGAITAANADVLGLAQSQIAAAQTQTALGSFNTQTQPAVGVEPNSNTPQIVYVQPQVVTTPAQRPPATTAPVKAMPTVTTPSRYYTYKRDVPLGRGQTVHFAAGRGYYAA